MKKPAIKLSKEEVIHAHLFILQEMRRRGMNHNTHDALDDETRAAARQLGLSTEELSRLGLVQKRDVVDDEAAKWAPLSGRDHVLIPDFVSIVGSAMRRSPDDLDLCIREPARNESLEMLLAREMGKHVADRLHFLYNPSGPHGDSLPLFDLVLRRKRDVRKIEVEVDDQDQVEKTEVNPLLRFQPLKPRGGRDNGEFFDAEKMLDVWAKPVLSGGVVVEPKFNGFRTVLEKDGDGNVLIYFEGDKKDKSKILPGVASDLKKIKGSFVVDAELMEMDPETGGPVHRTRLARFNGDSPQEDKNVVMRVFDILHRDGKSLADAPLTERKRSLQAWFRAGVPPRFKPVRAVLVKTPDAFLRAVKSMSKEMGSEGAMAKVGQSIYTLAGITDSWAKLRTLRAVTVRVLAVNSTPNPKLKNYTCGVGPIEREQAAGYASTKAVGDQVFVVLGNTFNSDIKAQPGDSLEVLVAEILVDKRGAKTKLGWVLPFVEAKTANKPVTPEQFVELATRQEILSSSAHVLKASENQARFDRNVKEGSKGRFILHLHERGTSKPPFSRHLDVRMSVDGVDNLEGLLLTSGKIPSTGAFSGRDLKALLEDGAQFLMPDYKPPQPKAWLTVARRGPVTVEPGGVGATRFEPGRFIALDYGAWEAGPQEKHSKTFTFKGEKGVLSGEFILNGIPKGAARAGRPINEAGKPTTSVPTDRVFVFRARPEVEKRVGAQLWGSSGGKSRIANRLIPIFPEHKTYVEPFAGGAAVFWAKQKEGTEVLNDNDKDIAEALRFVQNITPAQIAELKRMNWKMSVAHHRQLQASSPTSAAARFHRMAMLRFGGFMGLTMGGANSGNKSLAGINSANIGKTLDLFDRLPKAKARLAGVKLHGEDYRAVMKKYDGPDTFFFLDPPYTKTNQDLGEREFDHEAFWDFLAKLKGRFLVTYDAKPPAGKFECQVLRHSVTTGHGETKAYETHVITNYKAKRIAKVCGGACSGCQVCRSMRALKGDGLVRLLPVDKADEDRRVIFGVVLEPNSVDTQGDTISAEEIERAAHLWLARYQDRGFMHRQIVNGKVEIYESYLAPTNLTIGGQRVKKGTWLLMYHVLDDALWAAIKRGDLTGFSMGGFARRNRV